MNTITKINHNFNLPHEVSISDFLTLINEFQLTLISSIPIGPDAGNPNITVSATPTSITAFKHYVEQRSGLQTYLLSQVG